MTHTPGLGVVLLVVALTLSACGGSERTASVIGTAPTPAVVAVALSGYAGTIIAPTFPTQLTATATLSDGTTRDVTLLAIWSSSAPDIASVSGAGRLDGLLTGTAVIRATYQGISGTVTVTVLSGAR